MTDVKTKKTKVSVRRFIDSIKDEQQKQDTKVLVKLFANVTQAKPVMWGTAIIGYGEYTATYASGKTVHWMLTGFSPRKGTLSLYIHPLNLSPKLLKLLGPHKASMGCLYIKRLSDVDQIVLRRVIVEGITELKKMLSSNIRRGPVQGKARRK